MKRFLTFTLTLLFCLLMLAKPTAAVIDLSLRQDNTVCGGISALDLTSTIQTVYSGGCGDDGDTTTSSNVIWTLDTSTGVLTISGTGNMLNYMSSTSIPYYSYQNYITSINIEPGVTGIGNYAFYGCDTVTFITINDNIISIGNFSFYNCSGITSFSMSSKLISIGDSAFGLCFNLTSLTLPPSVTTIGTHAFRNCSALTLINWNATNVADFTNTSDVFFNAGASNSGMTIIFGNNVESIPNYAFCVSQKQIGLNLFPKIDSVIIGNKITSISTGAFSNCTIKSISIPNSVTTIEDSAFRDSNSLKSIDIPNSVTIISNFAFEGCSSLESIKIPSSVTVISNYAFQDCGSLESIKIPNSVTIIDTAVFESCSSLKSIDIPNSITTINDRAFRYCRSLKSIDIPNSVIYIGQRAFEESGLESLSLPNSHAKIDNYAFGCCPLSSIVIPDNIDSIGLRAFCGCPNLISITIGKGITTIDSYAFSDLPNLVSVNWNSTNVTNFTSSSNVFYCSGQSGNGITVNFGDNVQTIPSYAFFVASSKDSPYITKINIGENVASIGDYAFYSLKNIYSVNIPFVTSSIGPFAFNSGKVNINGYLNSYAQSYARENNINFFSLGYKYFSVSYYDNTTVLSLSPNQYAYGVGITSLPRLSKEGFVFVGWYQNAALTGNAITSIGTAQTGNVELYANWTPLYTINVIQNTGGFISPSSATVNYGASQTFAITANGGYEIQNVMVDGVSQGAIMSYTFTNVTATHTISATFKQKITVAFNDVPSGIWYETYVNDLVGKGILVGYGNSDGSVSFKPDKTISRAEFATILARTSGDDLGPYVNKTSFNDVTTSYWGAKYIEWAYQKGVVSGKGEGKYDPDANITRQEMAVMIHNYVTKYKKQTLPQTVPAMTFSDQNQIASWAATAVTVMQQAGIINGTANSDGSARFDPISNATRAQAAKMISAYLGL